MKKLILPIYTPGKIVYYKNNQYTVDHVRVQQYNLLVKLAGLSGDVNAGDVWCKPTEFILDNNTN